MAYNPLSIEEEQARANDRRVGKNLPPAAPSGLEEARSPYKQEPSPVATAAPEPTPASAPAPAPLPAAEPTPAPAERLANGTLAEADRYYYSARMNEPLTRTIARDQRREEAQGRKVERFREGLTGALAGGFEHTGAAAVAAGKTITGDLAGVEQASRFAQDIPRTKEQQAFAQAVQTYRDTHGDKHWYDEVLAPLSAVVEEPVGALHEMTAQVPNTLAVMAGSAGTGWLAMSAALSAIPTPVTQGTAFIMRLIGMGVGMFLGNSAIEGGNYAIDRASDGFSEAERFKSIGEGLIKGAVVTGVDMATLGLTKYLFGAPGRIADRAIRKSFMDAGVDITNEAAMMAARRNPTLVRNAIGASQRALKESATLTFGHSAARHVGAVALESLGEGIGEYGGELAAGRDPSLTEATLEALMGLSQSAIEVGVSKSFAAGKQTLAETLKPGLDTAAAPPKATPTAPPATAPSTPPATPEQRRNLNPQGTPSELPEGVVPAGQEIPSKLRRPARERAIDQRNQAIQEEQQAVREEGYKKMLGAKAEEQVTLAKVNTKEQQAAAKQPTAMQQAMKKAGVTPEAMKPEPGPTFERPKGVRSPKVMEAYAEAEAGGNLAALSTRMTEVANTTKSKVVRDQAVVAAEAFRRAAPKPAPEKTTAAPKTIAAETEVAKQVIAPERKKELVKTFKQDLDIARDSKEMLQRDVGRAIDEAAMGVIVGAQTNVDRVFDAAWQTKQAASEEKYGQRFDTTPEQFYKSFEKSREAIRAQVGDTIRLARFDAPKEEQISNKHTLNYALPDDAETVWAKFFKNDNRKIAYENVPVDDILAVNVGPTGTYPAEFIVLNRKSEGFVDPTAEEVSFSRKPPAPTIDKLPKNVPGNYTPEQKLDMVSPPQETRVVRQPKEYLYFNNETVAKDIQQGFKSREIVVEMDPQEFLAIAEEGFDAEKKARVDEIVAKGEDFPSTPFLGFENQGGGMAKAVSHEGRHRARKLIEMGVQKMPVVLKSVEGGKGPALRWGNMAPGDTDRIELKDFPTTLESEDTPVSIPFPVKPEDVGMGEDVSFSRKKVPGATTEAAAEQALLRSERSKKAAITRGRVNLQRDELKTVIAKLGGLSSEEAVTQGIDPAALKTRGVGIQRVFTKDGATFDQMAERLDELGFDVKGQGGGYDANKVVDLVTKSLAGTDVWSMQGGNEAAVDRAFEERQADQEFQRQQEDEAFWNNLADLADQENFNKDERDLTETLGRSREILGDDTTDDILERVSMRTENLSASEFHALLSQEIEGAIREKDTTQKAETTAGGREGQPGDTEGPSFSRKETTPGATGVAPRQVSHRRIKTGANKGNYVGAPALYNTPQKLPSLRKILRRLVEDGYNFREWYKESADAVLRAVGGDRQQAEKVIQLLAIFSPSNKVGGNTTAAIKAYHQWARGEQITAGRFTAHADAANKLMYGGENWEGRKTNSFYINLMTELDPSVVDRLYVREDGVPILIGEGESPKAGWLKIDTPVTVDMWIARIFGYPNDSVGTAQYHFAELEIQRVADEMGMTPHEAQAAMWVAFNGLWQQIGGGKPESDTRGTVRQDALNATLEERWLNTGGVSFGTYLGYATEITTWETVPSTSTPLGQTISLLDFAQKKAFTNDALGVIYDGATDLLAEKIGMPFRWTRSSTGAYEGAITPNVLTGAVADMITSETAPTRYDEKKVDLYSLALQYVYTQDAVPWFRPDIRASGEWAHRGAALQFNRNLTERDLGELLTVLRENVHPDIGFTQTDDDQITVINFRGEVERKRAKKTMAGPMPAKVQPLLLSDEDFYAKINELTNAQGEALGLIDAHELHAPGNYHGNWNNGQDNWTTDPKGKKLEAEIREAGGQDLLPWLRDRRNRAQAVARQYAGEQPSFSRNAGNAERNLQGTAERSTPPVREDGRVRLTHWSRKEGLQELDPDQYGTGYAGAERQRQQQDPDNWVNRTFFGITEGPRAYRREAGLGTNEYSVDVPLNELYDFRADPDGLHPQAVAEAQETGGIPASIYERLIRDAGYQGYWLDNQSMGMVVSMYAKTTPVAYSSSYTVEETTGNYPTDDTTKGEVRQGSGVDVAAAQLDLFSPTEVPAETVRAQAADNFDVKYRQVEVGTLPSAFDTVTNAETAAHIFAPIRKHAQETLMALVLDKDHKPISVIRHTKGVKDASSASPVELAAGIAGTDGATSVWLAHNHPAGDPTPSSADMQMTRAITSALEGSGIKVDGHVVVAMDGKAAQIDADGDVLGEVRIRPGIRKKSIAVTERMIRKRAPVDRSMIQSPQDAMAVARTLDSNGGLMLLDNRHRLVGVLSMTGAEMAKLRAENRVNRILKALDTTNAAAVVVFQKGNADYEGLPNMGNYLARLGALRVLDIIQEIDGEYHSNAARGISTGAPDMPFFSRGGGITPTEFPRSKLQLDAAVLNNALAKLPGFGPEWRNAYVQNKLPDSLSGFEAAVKAAFNRRVVPVTATEPRFDVFNGIYLPRNEGALYVSTQADVGFINVAGHELYHDLKRRRPDLHEWLVDRLRDHAQNFDEYVTKLDSMLQAGERKLTISKAVEELLADFTGDALADPAFLQKLADNNPSKFKQLLTSVIEWLKGIAGKIKGLGSERYVRDVETMRNHLQSALNAYANGDTISKVVGRPEFLPVWHGSPHAFTQFDINKVGTGEGAQAYGHGIYLAERYGVGSHYMTKLSSDSKFDAWTRDNAEAWNSYMNDVRTKNGTMDVGSWNPADDIKLLQLGKRPIKTKVSSETVALVKKAPKAPTGYMYEVELPDSAVDNMLDWDAPLSEQSDIVDKMPEEVKRRVRQAVGSFGADKVKGRDLYETFLYDYLAGETGGDASAFGLSGTTRGTIKERISNYLNTLGVPGIKYYDAVSRTAKEGTRNFVVFDPSSLKIISRNGVPMSGAVVNLFGRDIPVVLPERARRMDELVFMDTDKMDASFAKDKGFYIGPDGEGQIHKRYDNFVEWVQTADNIEASEVGFTDQGNIAFTNGRHRYAVMRDNGVNPMPVSLARQDVERARQLGFLVEEGLPADSGDVDFSRKALSSDQVTTPAFKRWFKNSSVVDETGEPMVVYHSTKNDFAEFKIYDDSLGAHFGTREAAQERFENLRIPDDVRVNDDENGFYIYDENANGPWEQDTAGRPVYYETQEAAKARIVALRKERASAPLESDEWGGQNIMPVYLSVQNPLVVRKDTGFNWAKSFLDSLPQNLRNKAPQEWRTGTGKETFSMSLEMGKVREWLQSLGYDGVKYTNEVEDKGSTSWIVFEKTQIKSATGNAGTFDGSIPDIRFSRKAPSPSQVVKNVDARMKKPLDAMRRWVRRNYTKEGFMPDVAFEQNVLKDSEMNAGEMDISYFARNFEKDVAKAFGVKRYDKVSEADLEAVNDYLGGKDVDLPVELKDSIDHLRTHLDRLSAGMLNAIRDMMAIEYGKMSDAQQAQFDNVVATGQGEVPQPMQKHFNLYQTINGNIGTYLTRSYQAFDDPKWMEKALANADLVARAEDFIRQRNPDLTDDEVIGAVGAVLQAAKDKGNFMSMISKGARVGSKDVSILTRRKQVPDIIRELLGEYKDPRLNYVKSASKMSWYLANHNFLMSLRNKGLGVFLYENPTKIGDTWYTKPLGAEGSETMNPIDGLYTTEDIELGMQDALNRFDGSDLMRNIIMINSMVKYGKTILAPTTQARNFMSAAMFTVMNGHFDWTKGATAGRATWSDLITKDEAWHAYMTKLTRLGVVHNNPYAGELRDAINDMVNMDFYGKGAVGNMKRFMAFVQSLYQVGDDFWKIIGFENEIELQMKKPGMTREKAEENAAYRIRNGYPTYSMVPRGIKKIRRWPLIGTFVSFPYEIVRTTYNQIGFLREDMKAGNTAAAARRATGMAIASSAAYAASVASMMLMGMDGDDDEAVRAQLPEWSRNAQLMYLGYDKNGMPVYIDLSYLDPYTYIKTPVSAILNGNNDSIDKKIVDALAQFLEPFIGPDIAAGTLGEIIYNKRMSGGEVYNPEDTAVGKMMSISNYVRKAIQPGFMSNLERTIKAIQGDASRSGKQYSLKDEGLAWIGFRLGTLNLPQSLIYKAYGFKDSKAQATTLLSYTAGSGSKVSDRELTRAVNSMVRARERAYGDMIKYVNGAMKLGMTRTEIYDTLRAAYVSKSDINDLLSGRIPRWSMSPTFLRSASQRAAASAVNEERRKELTVEMAKRRRLINQLVNQ